MGLADATEARRWFDCLFAVVQIAEASTPVASGSQPAAVSPRPVATPSPSHSEDDRSEDDRSEPGHESDDRDD